MTRILHTLLLSAAVAAGTAQTATTTYFMDGIPTRHTLNPAFAPEGNYVSMPLLGQTGGGYSGNVRLDDFIYTRPVNGQLRTVTFLHPGVAASDVSFPDRTRLNEELRLQVIDAGFRMLGGYSTVGISVREQGGINLPGELFGMMKTLANKDYDLGRGDACLQSWAELALGHSRRLNPHLRVGAKLKLLLGLAQAKSRFTDLRLNLESPDRWTVTGREELHVSRQGFNWGAPRTHTYNTSTQTYESVNWDNVSWGNRKVSVSGGGLAVDLGADYAFTGTLSGLSLSAALTDLGFLRWDDTSRASNEGRPFTFAGFHNVQVKGHEGDIPFKEQSDQLLDNLARFYNVSDQGNAHTQTSLGTTLNVGVAYTLPAWKRLTLGLLSTTRLQSRYGWNEERLSATVRPLTWLEICLSGAVGTAGSSWGGVLNVKPRYVNFYIGFDRYFGRLAKPFVPLGSGASAYLGLNFTFGR